MLLRYTADAYIALNLYPEALTTYREAANLLQTAGIPHDHAQALQEWGPCVEHRQRYVNVRRASRGTVLR